MARQLNGTNQSLSRSTTYLGSSGGPFTIAIWLRPASTSGSAQVPLVCGAPGAYWQVDWDNGDTPDALAFFVAGFTGSNPRTASNIALTSADLATGVFAAWRYRGAGNEWSKWKNGVKTVINGAITFALPALSGEIRVGSLFGTSHFYSGAVAEIAIWSTALHDEQLRELQAGVAADVIAPGPALLGYWPLRGNSTPERNYAVAAHTLALHNSPPAAAHPTIVPPWRADVAQPSWVVDLFHPNGTKRAATYDLTEDVDIDILGAKYTARLADDIEIADADPNEQAGGVMLPGQTVIRIRNEDGWLDRSWEWRQCRVRIREYDRATHALVTEFVGQVIDPTNMAALEAVFVCAGLDEALLRTRVPRQLIEVANVSDGLIDDIDGDEHRADLGAPIPLAFGEGGLATVPFLRVDDASSPGGADFIAAWGTAVRLMGCWYDYEPAAPGLEKALAWASAPGTPTSATTTTFAVTGDQSRVYTPGTPIRRSGDGGATWAYSTVVSYSGGTVTLREGILPASPTAIGLLEWGGELAVEKDRYKYVGVNTTFLTTLRFFGDGPIGAAVLAQLYNPTLINPAFVIKFLLEDPDQGLGQACNADSFNQAWIDFGAAGLGTAVRYVLGGDRQQRELLAVLNEICALRGAQVWRDPESGEWMIKVDTAPAVQSRPLEFGADLRNDIARVVSVSRTPLNQATAVLRLRYAAGGRQRNGTTFTQQEYAYSAKMTVLTGVGGTEHVLTSQVLRNHTEAKRVLYYRGKKRQRSDETIVFEMLRGGRRVRRGQVYPIKIPSDGIDGNYRIVARRRRLTQFTFTAVGPYNDDIYATDLTTINAAVSAAAAEAAPTDRARPRGSGVNLIANADFSTGLRRPAPVGPTDWTILPGWLVGPEPAAIAVTRDARAKGGYYLTLETGGDIAEMLATGEDDTLMSSPVVPGIVYLVSSYLDSDVAGGTSAGWAFAMYWLDDTGTIILAEGLDQVRIVPGDVNGFGWQRYYAPTRAPAGAAYAVPRWRFNALNSIFRLDAVQFEELSTLFGRPSEWSRNAPYGIEPVRLGDGDVLVRALSDPVAGMKLAQRKGTDYAAGGVTLSGTSTVVGTVGPGLLTGIAGFVKTAISGPASWTLALDYGGGVMTTVLSGLPVGADDQFGDAHAESLPIQLRSAVNIVAIPSSGSFSGGKVKINASVLQHVPPTS